MFSGIGGLELGLERAGLEVVWQVEIDEACWKVLAKNWPNVKRYADVRKVHATCWQGPLNREEVREEVVRVDVICGGFP